jgi:hypothetical protein
MATETTYRFASSGRGYRVIDRDSNIVIGAVSKQHDGCQWIAQLPDGTLASESLWGSRTLAAAALPPVPESIGTVTVHGRDYDVRPDNRGYTLWNQQGKASGYYRIVAQTPLILHGPRAWTTAEYRQALDDTYLLVDTHQDTINQERRTA